MPCCWGSFQSPLSVVSGRFVACDGARLGIHTEGGGIVEEKGDVKPIDERKCQESAD